MPVISALRLGRKGVKEDFGMGEDEDITSFKCERVCTSNRLLKRLGQLAKVWLTPTRFPPIVLNARHSL